MMLCDPATPGRASAVDIIVILSIHNREEKVFISKSPKKGIKRLNRIDETINTVTFAAHDIKKALKTLKKHEKIFSGYVTNPEVVRI